MKRRLGFVWCLVLFIVMVSHSMAESNALRLYCPAHQEMTLVDSWQSELAACDSYRSGDGLMLVEVFTFDTTRYGMIGDDTLPGRMDRHVNNRTTEPEEIACQGIGSYPAQRIRFEAGGSEDACVVDATALWTESQTFLYIVTVDADAWYGFREGYEEGAAQAMIDAWVSQLQIVTGNSALPQWTAVLIADRSFGNGDLSDAVQRFDAVSQAEIDENALSAGLSLLTGLDFSVHCEYVEGMGLMVDWQPQSTLVAGLGERAQKEEFFFYDAVSLNWFMMDSLYATLRENLAVGDIYYTMDGGRELQPMGMDFPTAFPVDIPYMGSAFYLAHSDVKGDDDAACEDNTYGFFDTWLDTEFFRIGIPERWEGLYEYRIDRQEPFGYTITFSEKQDGFVFSVEARWFDGEVAQLESVWHGYLGRMNVDRLGDLDLLYTLSQPAPDANENWQTLYEGCREVIDTLILQQNITLEMGEYLEYQP